MSNQRVGHQAGDKRSAETKSEEKRAPKVRRFDMKTRLPKTTDAGAVPQGVSRDVHRDRGSIVTTVLGKRAVHQAPSHGDGQSSMSVNTMFDTSLQLQQAREGNREEGAGGQQRNIVDQLFQDFVTSKMREVGEGEEGGPSDTGGGEGDQTPVSMSIDEINRLLDAEITSIKSRSVMPDLLQGDITPRTTPSDLPPVPQPVPPPVPQPVPPPPKPSMASVFSDSPDLPVPTGGQGGVNEAGEVKGVVVKKAPVKKLGLSIGQESLARILGNWKNGRILEDGEVASSTDSDAEKALKAEKGPDSEDSDANSDTGSLANSDKTRSVGKGKKKKKHKHKHKKKKKHKSNSKEKEKEGEGESSQASERRTSKDDKEEEGDKEKESPGKDDSKEPKSKEKKKSSRHRSRSRSRDKEDYDPWDARNYSSDTVQVKGQSPKRSRSRHKDRHRDRSRDRDRSRQRSRDRHRDRSRSKERRKRRSGSRGREKHSGDKDAASSDLRVKIDKNKLRKIAIARALANMEKGQGPSVNLLSAKSGGKSVAELTEFCKRISEKEQGGGAGLSSESDESEDEKGSEGEDGPLHHPFVMRDPGMTPNIVMNIRNSKQLPVLTPQEKQTQSATLRTQFPVSSGTQHRNKESEWVPVTPTTTTTTATTTTAKPAPTATPSVPNINTPNPAPPPLTASGPAMGGGGGGGGPPTLPSTSTVPPEQSVFPPVQPDIDISSIITERIQAMRRLEQNPFDMQALSSVHKVNQQANAWAQSKHLPGQFTGTTDVRILSQQELAGPDKRNQAWVKKDQFRRAPPVQGGIGMFLLQKMGWKPGDGLGKDNEGNKEPIMLDVKMDRKGLATTQDQRPPPHMMRPQNGPGGPPQARAKDLSGKHPVSALTELCTKRRWAAPAFNLVQEAGPPHKKVFLFTVRVNGVEYSPAAACGNKKLAKAQAAAACLMDMGLIPRDYVVQV